MLKRNISFYEIKKKIITKTRTLNERIVHIISKKGKVHIMKFYKGDHLNVFHIERKLFERRKLVER